MKPQVALLLKTYSGDKKYVDRLIPSFLKHNVESLLLYVVCEKEFAQHFDRFKSDEIIVIDEATFEELLFSEGEVVNPGYANQAVIKLAFGLLGLCENYFAIDSDAVFIKDFGARSFVSLDGRPFLVATEDKELCIDPNYYKRYWEGRYRSIRKIAELLNYRTLTEFFPTCHGHQVFSSASVASLAKLLAERKLDFKQAIEISPYEFSWYTLFVQQHLPNSFVRTEPLIWTAHSADLLSSAVIRGVAIKDIGRAHIGICVNSNYGRFAAAYGYDDWGNNLVSWSLIIRLTKVAGRLCARKLSPLLFLKRGSSYLRRNLRARVTKA